LINSTYDTKHIRRDRSINAGTRAVVPHHEKSGVGVSFGCLVRLWVRPEIGYELQSQPYLFSPQRVSEEELIDAAVRTFTDCLELQQPDRDDIRARGAGVGRRATVQRTYPMATGDLPRPRQRQGQGDPAQAGPEL